MRLVFTVTAVALAVLAGATASLAQPPGAVARVVTGTVKDVSGAALPAATVDALVAGLEVASVVTSPNGTYRIELTAGARHRLRARKDGFAEEAVDLGAAAGTTSHDFVLGIAAVSDTVVVTPARLAESRAATSESVAVFTARDIESLGSSSLGDLARMVPGLNTESTGREGALTALFSRGGESDYNLVMVDGVRMNTSGGAFDFSRVSAAEIDRLEVVRGAQSALYGSDAIGSVVQVITKRAAPGDPPTILGSVEGGSFGSWRGDARVLGGARRRVDYNLGVTYRGSEGAFQDILPEHDRFDETTVDGGIGAILGDAATLRTGLRYANANGKGIGQIVYGDRDTGTASDTRDLSWHVDFTHRISPRVNQRAMFGYSSHDRLSADTIADPTYHVHAILDGTPGALFPASPRLVRLLDPATFAAYLSGAQALTGSQFLATTPFGVGDFTSTSEATFRRPAFKYQTDFTWADGQVLSGGYDYERETDPLHADFLVENHAYFVQQRLTARDRMFATLGARIDRNSRYGNNVSPKAGGGVFFLPYRPGAVSSVKAFANVGRGIKNPAFGELYDSAYTDGNPHLGPERARTVDAGVEGTFDGQRFLGRVTYFNNQYNDQVAFKSTGFGLDGRPDFINIDGSEAKGWELEAGLQRPIAGGLTGSGGYGFVDTKVVSFVTTSEQFQPGQPLLRRPKHAAMMRLTYARGRGLVTFNLRHVGERHDASFVGLSAVPSPRFPVGRSVDITVNPAYTLTWLGGEVQLGRSASAYVRLDNLTDVAYESALGYPGLPRSVVGGLRFVVGTRR